MKAELGYGNTTLGVEIPDANYMGSLKPNQVEIDLRGEAEVRRALNEPIASEKLSKLVKPGMKVVVITSDITRPIPSRVVLPPVLEELEAGGVADEDITVVFALGSHRGHTEEERKYMAGEAVYNRYKCVDSNPDDTVHLGTTAQGTPVDIFRTVAEADFVVCMGNIEYHYFVGYSGGVKAIMPGVSTRNAIQNNHRNMTHPKATAGNLEGNPVRADIEEAGAILGVDFIVNVVLDEHKEIIKAFCGDSIKAHRLGCAFLDSFYKISIPQQADIVIASQGGYPKDQNMYQAQKALDNAAKAVKDGGTIIWVVECREGLGEKHFEEWILGHESPDAIVDHIHREFILGAHKAAAIAMVLQRVNVVLVSSLDDDFVRKIFMEPAASVQEALDKALEKYGKDAKVLLMPYGGSTLPVIA